jgi:hypothetical protein
MPEPTRYNNVYGVNCPFCRYNTLWRHDANHKIEIVSDTQPCFKCDPYIVMHSQSLPPIHNPAPGKLTMKMKMYSCPYCSTNHTLQEVSKNVWDSTYEASEHCRHCRRYSDKCPGESCDKCMDFYWTDVEPRSHTKRGCQLCATEHHVVPCRGGDYVPYRHTASHCKACKHYVQDCLGKSCAKCARVPLG